MLTKNAQSQLFERFCNDPLKKSINQNFSFENLQENFKNKIDNVNDFSNVVYFDISNFSKKVEDFTSVDIKNFLEKYYAKSLKYIKQYNGQIDKIMGDGIIVVFSKIFGEINQIKRHQIMHLIVAKN
jgi:hypothetical protein